MHRAFRQYGGVGKAFVFSLSPRPSPKRIVQTIYKAFFDILNKTKKSNDSVSIWLCIENVVLLRIEP